MADLLIKGFDMPKGCYYDEPPYHCPFYDCLKCTILNTYAPARPYKYLPDCPLVEVPTHGELVDRDKLLALMSDEIIQRGGNERSLGIAWAQSAVEVSPTVIEASEGGEQITEKEKA